MLANRSGICIANSETGHLLVFLLVAGGLYFLGPRSAPPGVTMTDLHGVADLQARFNADRGLPRLVVIFSPT
jgi:hypothetical protein